VPSFKDRINRTVQLSKIKIHHIFKITPEVKEKAVTASALDGASKITVFLDAIGSFGSTETSRCLVLGVTAHAPNSNCTAVC
jgi:hypothetical protein